MITYDCKKCGTDVSRTQWNPIMQVCVGCTQTMLIEKLGGTCKVCGTPTPNGRRCDDHKETPILVVEELPDTIEHQDNAFAAVEAMIDSELLKARNAKYQEFLMEELGKMALPAED